MFNMSGTRANASVCRALKLILSNVGGSKLGGTESTTLGSPMKYTMTVCEWEERLLSSGDGGDGGNDNAGRDGGDGGGDGDDGGDGGGGGVGWEPYHVTRGFAGDASVVTVMAVTSGPHQVKGEGGRGRCGWERRDREEREERREERGGWKRGGERKRKSEKKRDKKREERRILNT